MQKSRTVSEENKEASSRHRFLLFFLLFLPVFTYIHHQWKLPTLFDVYNSLNRVLEANAELIKDLEGRCAVVEEDLKSRHELYRENQVLRLKFNALSNKTKALLAEAFELLEENSALKQEREVKRDEIALAAKNECDRLVKNLNQSHDALVGELKDRMSSLYFEMEKQKTHPVAISVPQVSKQPSDCEEQRMYFNFDRTGEPFMVTVSRSARECQIACEEHTLCRAWSYSKLEINCRLFSDVSSRVEDSCCITGSDCTKP